MRFDIFQIFVTVVVAAAIIGSKLSNHFPVLHQCHFIHVIKTTKLFHSSSGFIVHTVLMNSLPILVPKTRLSMLSSPWYQFQIIWFITLVNSTKESNCIHDKIWIQVRRSNLLENADIPCPHIGWYTMNLNTLLKHTHTLL